MKKLKRVCAIILFFTIFNFNHIYANEYNYDKITNVNIHIDGQVYIDTQINGVSVDYKKSAIEISNISIEIEENGEKKTYTNFKESNNSDSTGKVYSIDTELFSSQAKIIIKGQVLSDELNVNMPFEKEYQNEELKSFLTSNECNIEITSRDLKNFITYDVIFKTEEGGTFQDEQNYIEHTSILKNEKFPTLPQVIGKEGYEFLGWYDEETNEPIKTFPQEVTKDYTIIAKWQPQNSQDTVQTSTTKDENKNNEVAELNKSAENMYSHNPPKTAVENNILILIVSYIIKLTVDVRL